MNDVVNLKLFAEAQEFVEHSGLEVADAMCGLLLSQEFVERFGYAPAAPLPSLPPLPDEEVIFFCTWIAHWVKHVALGHNGRSGVGVWKAAIFCISHQVEMLNWGREPGVADEEIEVTKAAILAACNTFHDFQRAGAL